MDSVERSIALEAEGHVQKMITPVEMHCICGESIKVDNAWQAENEKRLVDFDEAHWACRKLLGVIPKVPGR